MAITDTVKDLILLTDPEQLREEREAYFRFQLQELERAIIARHNRRHPANVPPTNELQKHYIELVNFCIDHSKKAALEILFDHMGDPTTFLDQDDFLELLSHTVAMKQLTILDYFSKTFLALYDPDGIKLNYYFTCKSEVVLQAYKEKNQAIIDYLHVTAEEENDTEMQLLLAVAKGDVKLSQAAYTKALIVDPEVDYLDSVLLIASALGHSSLLNTFMTNHSFFYDNKTISKGIHLALEGGHDSTVACWTRSQIGRVNYDQFRDVLAERWKEGAYKSTIALLESHLLDDHDFVKLKSNLYVAICKSGDEQTIAKLHKKKLLPTFLEGGVREAIIDKQFAVVKTVCSFASFSTEDNDELLRHAVFHGHAPSVRLLRKYPHNESDTNLIKTALEYGRSNVVAELLPSLRSEDIAHIFASPHGMDLIGCNSMAQLLLLRSELIDDPLIVSGILALKKPSMGFDQMLKFLCTIPESRLDTVVEIALASDTVNKEEAANISRAYGTVKAARNLYKLALVRKNLTVCNEDTICYDPPEFPDSFPNELLARIVDYVAGVPEMSSNESTKLLDSLSYRGKEDDDKALETKAEPMEEPKEVVKKKPFWRKVVKRKTTERKDVSGNSSYWEIAHSAVEFGREIERVRKEVVKGSGGVDVGRG